jgi:hypothetical protein
MRHRMLKFDERLCSLRYKIDYIKIHPTEFA